MALRLIDIYFQDGHHDVRELVEQYDIQDHWSVRLEEDRHLVRILIDTNKTESLLDGLHEYFGGANDFRVIVSSVEAALPRPGKIVEEAAAAGEVPEAEEQTVERISRDELWQDLEHEISGTRIYHALVALSTIVAAGGMMRDSVAIVIGAMVIAPLIGPNIAFAFATTVGNKNFLLRSLTINLSGLIVGFVLSVVVGFFLLVDPTVPEIANRTMVHWSDIVLALAAGSAGVLSFTRGISTALIGVMVAVALLPPLVATGLLLGSGYAHLAYGASLLVLTNVVCINLAAVVTLLLQGIRPIDWYEAEKARRHTRIAIALWGLLLAVLLVLAVVLGGEPLL